VKNPTWLSSIGLMSIAKQAEGKQRELDMEVRV